MVEELEKKDAVKRALSKAEDDAKEGKTTTAANSKPSPKESSTTSATDTPKKSKSAANRNKKVSFME